MPRKMRRGPREGAKVWHNPDVVVPRRHPVVRQRPTEPAPAPTEEAAVPTPPASRRQLVSLPTPPDERELERARLLEKLRVAEGRAAITRAAAELKNAGFEPAPDDQEAFLQLLEHSDESVVQGAIADLGRILAVQPPKRFAVLESRLRRLEELADDPATQTSAARLRRLASGRA